MLTLLRGISLTIDQADGGRLLWGSPTGLSFSQTPVTLWLTLGGYFDPASGFVVNVCDVDDMMEQRLVTEPIAVKSLGQLFDWSAHTLDRTLPGIKLLSQRAELHENLQITIDYARPTMLLMMRKYEIAAAHVLKNPDWDQAKNQKVFGKCNNAAGHGHNYTLEVTVTGKPDPDSGNIIEPQHLDDIVKTNILDKFDHKFLNIETAEFSNLNPTVENIAKVFWDLLNDRCAPAQLAKVGVWETPRTYAEYSGPAIS